MAYYVYSDFHRDRGRVRPHVQYIADREHSRGVRGLGQEFRQVNGDVEKVIRLFHEHAAECDGTWASATGVRSARGRSMRCSSPSPPTSRGA